MSRSPKPKSSLRPALVAAMLIVVASNWAAAQDQSQRARFIAELSAGPLVGIDRPLRGCSGQLLAGLRLAPFEAGLRAGGAYDASLDTGDLRFDLVVGLGGGLRAIVGCLLLFGEPALPDSGDESGASVAAAPADWPNRFGIAATIAELPFRILGARPSVETELMYTAYRVEAATALTGAPAFAAGVEASLALRLAWEP